VLCFSRKGVLRRELKKIIELICVLPVTSASCERSFSGLKIIKTRLRSTMGEEFFDALLLTYMERDLAKTNEESVDKIIDLFRDMNVAENGKKGSRRNKL